MNRRLSPNLIQDEDIRDIRDIRRPGRGFIRPRAMRIAHPLDVAQAELVPMEYNNDVPHTNISVRNNNLYVTYLRPTLRNSQFSREFINPTLNNTRTAEQNESIYRNIAYNFHNDGL